MTKLNKVLDLIEEEFPETFDPEIHGNDVNGYDVIIRFGTTELCVGWLGGDHFYGYSLELYNRRTGEFTYEKVRKTLRGVRGYLRKHVE